MNVRQRINQYYATISVILASLIGLVANSWIVFGVAAGILLGLHLIGGAIRLGDGSRRHPRGRRPAFQRQRRHASAD